MTGNTKKRMADTAITAADVTALDQWRSTYPFVLRDGRRFRTLECAGHSLVVGVRVMNRGRNAVVEESRDSKGKGKEKGQWVRREIPYEVAVLAYEMAKSRHPVVGPETEDELGISGTLSSAPRFRPGSARGPSSGLYVSGQRDRDRLGDPAQGRERQPQ